MAYITGEYKYLDYDIEVLVLEPTKDEGSYSEGRKVDIQWMGMDSLSTKQFGEVIKWFNAVNIHIKKNFDRKGRKKSTYTEFQYKEE